MSKLFDSLQKGNSYTQNGAITNQSSLDACLDFFFLAGASRNMENRDILQVFLKAYGEDPSTALKILFWTRDIRWWAGERRIFRIIWKYLLQNKKEVAIKLAPYVSEYGRFDDLFNDENNKDYIVPDEILSLIKKELELKNGLLAKWLPRKGIVAKQLQKFLNLSEKDYRKLIVSLSNTVEQKISKNEWEDIKLNTVPSCAFNQYKKAWERHILTKYHAFLEKVEKGEEKMNAKDLYPYQVFRNIHINKDLANAQWKNLPDYWAKGDILPVIDVSGSMTTTINKSSVTAKDIAMSIWLYLSERIKGRFNNCFISFSWRPNIHKISEGTLYDKYNQIDRSGEDMNTNLKGVFDIILSTAIRDNLKQEDLPKTIIILSDMEFDMCYSHNSHNKTIFEILEKEYKEHGYTLPNLIFWNILWRIGNYPVTKDSKNVALVSGASPSVITSILNGSDISPLSIMLKTIWSDRYKNIW